MKRTIQALCVALAFGTLSPVAGAIDTVPLPERPVHRSVRPGPRRLGRTTFRKRARSYRRTRRAKRSIRKAVRRSVRKVRRARRRSRRR
ncbi:MAG: hypothetical protein ACE5JG_09110 [Planctomycetota bacterium]